MMVNMRLTSRSEPGPEPGPSIDDDLDSGITGLLRYRRLVIRVLLVIFLLLPAASARHLAQGHRPPCLPDPRDVRVRGADRPDRADPDARARTVFALAGVAASARGRAGRGDVRGRGDGLAHRAGGRVRGGGPDRAGRPGDRPRPGVLHRDRGGDQRRDRPGLQQHGRRRCRGRAWQPAGAQRGTPQRADVPAEGDQGRAGQGGRGRGAAADLPGPARPARAQPVADHPQGRAGRAA